MLRDDPLVRQCWSATLIGAFAILFRRLWSEPLRQRHLSCAAMGLDHVCANRVRLIIV